MTLTEVVVVIALMGVMSVAIAGTISVVYRSQGGITRAIADAHDVTRLVDYFPADVESGPAEYAAFRIAGAGSGTGCSDDGDVNAISFDTFDGRVAYMVTVSGATARLERYECVRDSDGAWQAGRVATIADGLDASGELPPAFAWANRSDADPELVESVVLRIQLPGGPQEVVGAPRRAASVAAGPICATANPVAATLGHGAFARSDPVVQGGTVVGTVASPAALGPDVVEAAFDELEACSAAVGQLPEGCLRAGCASHVVPLAPDGQPYPGSDDDLRIGAGPNGAQVLNVPAAKLAGDITGFLGGSPTHDRPLIVNVIGDTSREVTIDMSTSQLQGLGEPQHVLVNFPNAEHVTVHGDMWGTLLAPFADVVTYGELSGGIVAASWTHDGGTASLSDVNRFDGAIGWVP